jgi:hypothetical protein
MASAGRFCAEPCNQIIQPGDVYPPYDPNWTKADCNDYSFSGLYENYGPDVGRNWGWIDNDTFDSSVEGADCSAYVGRCLALPGFMPENHRKGHQEVTSYMYNNGLRDKELVKRCHRVFSEGTVSEEMDRVEQWDFFVWNYTRNSCGQSSSFGGHTGMIRTFSGSTWNTREAMNPSAGIRATTRSRQQFIDRCTHFWRRDNWGDVITPPVIVTPPQSRTNNLGDNAAFSVVASGAELRYQWRFNGVAIGGATNSAFNFIIASTNTVGAYSVVVSNVSTSVTSANAYLVIPFANRIRIAQWNFNSVTPDADVTTGTTAPSHGSGTFSIDGGLTADYNTGSPADSASSGTDNSSRRFAGGFPSATGDNKSAGWRINVSTVGYTNLVVTWEQRQQADASKYNRLQYTTDGATWVDHTVHTMTVDSTHVFQAADLSGITAVHDNPNFGVRVLTEWESTATGLGTAGFVGTTTAYSTSANMLYDLVTVLGSALPAPPLPPNQAPMLSPIANCTVMAGTALVFTNYAYDPNPLDTLTFSLDPGAPPTSSVHPTSGVFAWTPADADTNTIHHITVRVTDNGVPPMSGTAAFSVTVVPAPPPNRPPLLMPVPSCTIHAGSTVTFTNSAYDPDPEDTLTFSLDPGAPAGAAIHFAAGVFSWTTSEADAGTVKSVTVRVTDDGQPPMSGTATFSISVAPCLAFQRLSTSDGVLTLRWSALAGVTYRVQYKNSLTAPEWKPLGDVTANGSTASIEDAEPGSPGAAGQRFYRIQIQE